MGDPYEGRICTVDPGLLASSRQPGATYNATWPWDQYMTSPGFGDVVTVPAFRIPLVVLGTLIPLAAYTYWTNPEQSNPADVDPPAT